MIFARAFLLSLFLLLVFAGGSRAAVQTMQAHMSFQTTLSLSAVESINLGYLKAGQAASYTITPQGQLSASVEGVILGGQTQGGALLIAGSTDQTIDISAVNYTANNGSTPSAATCSYDGGAALPCALVDQPPPGAGKTLLVGLTVAVDGTQAAGTVATPGFDILVLYH